MQSTACRRCSALYFFLGNQKKFSTAWASLACMALLEVALLTQRSYAAKDMHAWDCACMGFNGIPGGCVAHPEVCTARVPTVMSIRLMLPLEYAAAAVNLGTLKPGPTVTSAIGDDTYSPQRASLGTVICTSQSRERQSWEHQQLYLLSM